MKNIDLFNVKAQYIVNPQGKKTAVILDIKTFEEMVNELEDLYLGLIVSKKSNKSKKYCSFDDIKKSITKKSKNKK